MSEINFSLEGTAEFTRKWLEDELQEIFNDHKREYINGKEKSYKRMGWEYSPSEDMYLTLKDVDIVFLAGGTCRIPFFKKIIKKLSPKAEIIIDGQLEIITATGAAIHALQVLSGEVEPYIKILENKNNESDPSTEQSEQLDGSSSNSNIENKSESNGDEDDSIQPEIKNDEKMEVDVCESKSKSHEEVESSAQDCGGKNDNLTDFSNVDETEYNEFAAASPSESNNPEKKENYSTTDAETFQEEESPKEKPLLP